MNLLGLPGRNPGTFEWMGNLLGTLELGQQSTTVIRYDCWTSGGELDLAHETARARDADPDLVVAKSIGTIVAINAFASGATRRFVMIGTPLRIYKDRDLDLLGRLADACSVRFIQQTDDRAGSMADLRTALSSLPSGWFLEVPGDDHAYSDIAALKWGIERWFAGPT